MSLAAVGGIFVPKYGGWYRQGSGLLACESLELATVSHYWRVSGTTVGWSGLSETTRGVSSVVRLADGAWGTQPLRMDRALGDQLAWVMIARPS